MNTTAAKTPTNPNYPPIKKNRLQLSLTPKFNSIYGSDWFLFNLGFNTLRFKIDVGSYFDERIRIDSNLTMIIALIGLLAQPFLSWYFMFLWIVLILVPFGRFVLYLPLYTGVQDAEWKSYGFAFDSEQYRGFIDHLVIYIGGTISGKSNIFWFMPWYYQLYAYSYLSNDMATWIVEKANQPKNFAELEVNGSLYKTTHSFIYKCPDGSVQHRQATIKVCVKEWRWKGLMWCSWLSQSTQFICVDFDQEVGPGFGSWKGGTLSCSYEMLPNEKPLEALQRLEQDKDFFRP